MIVCSLCVSSKNKVYIGMVIKGESVHFVCHKN